MKKEIIKKIGLAFLFMGIICTISYQFIETTIDKDGRVNEPFFLVPISYLFLLCGLFFLSWNLLKKE